MIIRRDRMEQKEELVTVVRKEALVIDEMIRWSRLVWNILSGTRHKILFCMLMVVFEVSVPERPP